MRTRTASTRSSTAVALAVAFCAAGIALSLVARYVTGPKIRIAHTEFLFAQLDQAYSDFLRAGNKPVESQASLLELISTRTIDWNSCKLDRDGTILDAWDNPVQVQIDSPTIHLRSAGPDRRLHTPDDVARDLGNAPAA